MTTPITIIRILPATSLPCSAIDTRTGARCGKPATAAYAEEVGDGRWLVEPFCRECWVKEKESK